MKLQILSNLSSLLSVYIRFNQVVRSFTTHGLSIVYKTVEWRVANRVEICD